MTVVGAGFAGLSTASSLAKAGHSVSRVATAISPA
ncbi:NAD(P)-binding protein [Mesorhizobium sp. 113-1-2]|nr:NAD(P)-binding protein [Mesorhizobium sp. 113-1-2]